MFNFFIYNYSNTIIYKRAVKQDINSYICYFKKGKSLKFKVLEWLGVSL